MAVMNSERLQSEVSRQAAIEEFRNRPESETGWDRVKEMYTVRHIENVEFDVSPELAVNGTAFKLAALAGFLTEAFNQWKPAKEIFIRQNRDTKFLGQKDFTRQGVHFQVKYIIRHGARFGIRLGLFTGLYCLGTTTLAMYNNRLSTIEYGASGVLAGALWQAKLGLGGVVMGGISGGLLSLLAGLACVKVMETNNEDIATIRYTLHSEKLKDWERKNRLKAEWSMKEMVQEAKKEIGDGKAL